MKRPAIATLLAMTVTFGAGSVGAQSVDKTGAETAMMKADREFNQAVADHGLPRVLLLVAENASFESADGSRTRCRCHGLGAVLSGRRTAAQLAAELKTQKYKARASLIWSAMVLAR